jgi:hypothetical protein
MSNYVTHIRREQRKPIPRVKAVAAKKINIVAPARITLRKTPTHLTPQEWQQLQELVLAYVVLRMWHTFTRPK